MPIPMTTTAHGCLGDDMEFIRIWAHEVPEYEAQGWRLSSVTSGKPCEVLLGPGYADCLMVREREDEAND